MASEAVVKFWMLRLLQLTMGLYLMAWMTGSIEKYIYDILNNNAQSADKNAKCNLGRLWVESIGCFPHQKDSPGKHNARVQRKYSS